MAETSGQTIATQRKIPELLYIAKEKKALGVHESTHPFFIPGTLTISSHPRRVTGESRLDALCLRCNVNYRLADIDSRHTRYTHLRHVDASLGKVDTMGKIAQNRFRTILAVSLLRGVPF